MNNLKVTRNKKLISLKFIMLFLFGIFLILFFSFNVSGYVASRPQYTQSGFGYSSGIFGSGNAETFDSRMCEAGQDFVLQVAPLGCTPAVVRSDLLEEQDTWVYCPIAATKINPLIKIEAINYLTFKNEEFSKYVSDIGFHPVRSALGVQDKVTSPVLENIGYAVVKLKRIPTEAEMPDFVEGNVTARLVYDIENAFGTFRTGFYLKPMKDEEWNKEFLRNGFWRGKGYIRAEDVQSDKATISVYSGNTISRSSGSYQQKLATFSLKKGEESQQVYLPTFDYCLGGLKVKLDDIKDPDTTARLKINADDVEVVRGEKFLDNKCSVNKIEKIGLNQKVIISCEEDLAEGGFLGFGSSKTFKLETKPKIELKIDDKTGNYSIGEWLFDAGEKAVFLSYAYTKKDSPYAQDLRVVFTALPKEDVGSRKQLTEDELNSFKGFIERYRNDEPDSGVGAFWKTSWDKAEGLGFLFEIFSRWAISGESFDVLDYKTSDKLPKELGIPDAETKQITVLGLASPSDSEAMKDNLDYKNAMKDFDILYSDFSSIKEYELKDTPAYGQRAYEEKIKLARDTGQKRTMYELCEQFKNKYPTANIDEVCFNEFEFASDEISSEDVLINNKVKEISLRSIYEPTFDDYGAKILVRYPNGERKEFPLQKEDIVYLDTKGTANLPEKLSESEALKIVSNEGIKWKDSVKFAGVRAQTLLEIIDLKEKCKCDILITSVTDGKHASGTESHSTGYKIDLRSKDKSKGEEKKLFDYITNNFVRIEDRTETDGTKSKQWKNEGGAIYTLEYEGKDNEHWDVLVTGERTDLLSKTSASSNQFIQLKELETISGKGFAVVRVNIPRDSWTDPFKFTDSIKLEEGVSEVVSTKDGFYEFTLKEVNIKKVAKVSVLPKINYAESESTFNFKIGIDKRDIKLAPEKTKERIEKLNKTIEDFEKVSEAMGKTIKGFKGACLGVGGALHIKNLAQNAQGKGIARQKVMRGDGGWYEICADMVTSGTYSSQEQCLIKESENIDKDVQAMTETLKKQQTDIQTMQNEYKLDTTFLEEKMINTTGFAGKYLEQVSPSLTQSRIDEINKDEKGNERAEKDKINLEKMQTILTEKGFTDNQYDTEELREIDLSIRTLNSDASERMKKSAKANLYATLLDIQKNSKSFVELNSLTDELKNSGFGIGVGAYGREDSIKGDYHGETILGKDISKEGIDSNTQYPVKIVIYNGKRYFVILQATSGNEYIVGKAYEYNGISNNKIQLGDEKTDLISGVFSKFTKYDKSSYANQFKRSADHNTPVVRYYDTEAYKNLPSVVPFDLKNGWYAAARQNLPVLGNIKSYDASGRVNNFYLCNVGSDGIEEFFSGIGDDICQQIFLESSKTYRSFPGLSESDANNLVESAVSAIEQASTARSRNPNLKIGETIRINTRVGGSINVKVGSPAVDVPNIQCEDFMSPKECNLIFNLCDPVICPNSRCDFGGEYPVKDVIQSGVVGSTLLCLPNAKENIYVPVCLTGIQAGVDGFNSVLKASKDCLQTSLDTGETIGICDEIQSVYMCEFFWRQAAPIGKIGISKVTAKVFGQGTRGGGEYLSVANAWESASKSIEYFTQSYGLNSYQAFKARTASEQLATPVCKGFISGAVPKLETFFNAVTEPDSPAQFTARFDEIPYSDTTVTPISQYKVFYTIYAGKDQPAYYQVYLKPDAEGSLYADATMLRNVASGFIPAGESVAETKDFTAPAGYKKLCINVNGYEECGFKEVSTSFAVDYVKDKYAQEQITKTGISSEKECASGTPSLYNFLTPNIQSSAEGAISPEIYKRGITRICATNNPGQGIDESRWIETGRCSDVGQNVKCWLDRQSMDDALQFAGTKNETITELEKIWIKGLNLSEDYEKDFNLKYEEIEDADGKTKEELDLTISKATLLLGKTFFNKQKAKVFLLRGQTYADLAILAYKNWKDKQITTEDKGEDKKDEEKKDEEKKDEEKKDETSENGAKELPPFTSFEHSFIIENTDETFKIEFSFVNENWYVGVPFKAQTTQAQLEDFIAPIIEQTKWIIDYEAVNRINEFDLTDEEKVFIRSFVRNVGNYETGLKQLIDETAECADCKLINDEVEMSSKKVFEFELKESEKKILLYYKNNKWLGEEYSARVGGAPKDHLQKILKLLEGKSFYDGAQIIFETNWDSFNKISEKVNAEGEISLEYDKFIKESSEKYDVDFNLIKAVIQVESNFNSLAISNAGAVGLMQLMPGTARDLGLKVPSQFTNNNPGTKSEIEKNKNNDERFNSEKNIDAGTKYLDSLLEKYKNKKYPDYEKLALAAYNGGPGTVGTAISKTGLRDDQITWEKVKEQIQSSETKNYPEKVINVKTSLSSAKFSGYQLTLIKNSKDCGDCGTIGIFGSCNKAVCDAIGEKLKRECEFYEDNFPLYSDKNCVESREFRDNLNIDLMTANLVDQYNVDKFVWNGTTALIILKNTINAYPEENGRKYSDNKYFVDQLYKQRLLNKEEYNEIVGEGLFDVEEDMKEVYDLLKKNPYIKALITPFI